MMRKNKSQKGVIHPDKNKKLVNNVNKYSHTRADLNIISWNIQSSRTTGGSKFDDADFSKILTQNDIICLQEIRQASKFQGYRSHSVLRESQRSGGVGIMYKNELKPGIQIVNKYDTTDVIVCKLKKSFFKFKSDRYIVNAYVTPATSSGNNGIDGKDLLYKISNIVNELQADGQVYLCGDFNSRIADSPGLVENETPNRHLPLPDDYICDNFTRRSTQDLTTNNFCKDFLSLIMNNSLTIANGRTLGDFRGNYTCITPRGSSVVDYFAASSTIYHTLSRMEVLPFTIFSDHRPLRITVSNDILEITPSLPINQVYDPAPTRYVYDNSGKANFMKIQTFNEFRERHNRIREELDLKNTEHIEHLTRPDITELNETYTTYLNDMADKCFKKTSILKNKKRASKQPWFNWACIKGKRLLNKAARTTSEFPESDFLREQFYSAKKEYRKLIKKHESRYYHNLNKQIEDGQVLNWNQFKRLKSNKSDKTKFDGLDMSNFESFFADLYTDKHKTIDTIEKEIMLNMANQLNKSTILSDELEDILNKKIQTEEVSKCILTLKNGKASANDLISNEILKCLDKNNIEILKDLFNVCFEAGVYPWNSNIITPLHKKGNKDNPDNYRAVAVSSVLGKLFSTILLGRFISFRRQKCPDPPNQLGFTKGAQTADHILTMQTIIDKYKRLRKPVYAIFVDFKKAFDSVCRPALFLKLAKSGITGKFYSVLKDMYEHSYGHIKLEGHISKRFNIRKGTEQGHPLSPDLFKHFLNDLSPLVELSNCPELAGIKISHLLWADDLILLSLDKVTAQKQLDALHGFCKKWGIEVNSSKTKAMIISENIKIDHHSFSLGSQSLKNVDEYCYLGITLHKSGSIKPAVKALTTKATRAFYGLKRTIMRASVSFAAMSTLFDSLIKPVLLYGAPIWLPSISVVKQITKELKESEFSPTSRLSQNLTKKLSNLPCEKVHLSFLRWALGVHRKSSTIGMWGDTGRYPLLYQTIKLTLDYYKRIQNLKSNSLVFAALKEQKSMNLPWYKTIKGLLEVDEIYHKNHVEAFRILSSHKTKPLGSPNRTVNPRNQNSTAADSSCQQTTSLEPLKSELFRPLLILKQCKEHFVSCWKLTKDSSPKLGLFYSKIKCKFNKEPYLKYVNNAKYRYRMCRLRLSAHDLEIEIGRYKNIAREKRICMWCNISMGDNCIEDENHLLFRCDLYNKPRKKLIATLQNLSNKFHQTLPSDPEQSDSINNIIQAYSEPINRKSLQKIFWTLHSPNVNEEPKPGNPSSPNLSLPVSTTVVHPLAWHHKIDFKSKASRMHGKQSQPLTTNEPVPHSTVDNLERLRGALNAYIHNAICTYVGHCFETRWNFIADLNTKTIGPQITPQNTPLHIQR